MSRRAPNPAEARAAQNQATIKSLLKLEGNKSCADCKRNKHPRWASWNLGIFICIRCSGIHRGMGTHISRVKSVDLDAWTDEQLQSVLKWGNARANKYWEAKLAPGHVPSEAKIENFIRTKYEAKRWVMDGPMPDPATLDADGDDDIPLNLVKEKHQLERSSSQKASSASPASGPSHITRAPQPDLFADVSESASAARRSQTTSPPLSRPSLKAEPAPARQTKPADSLLGLDFFGTEAAPPPNRPSSAAAAPGIATQSRPDLKQSILSLYASAPRPQPQSQPTHTSQQSFGGMVSGAPAQQKSSMGGLDDAFGGLSFGGAGPSNPASKPSAFAGLGNLSSHASPLPQSTSSASILPGGGFFDIKPAQRAQQPAAPQHSRGMSNSGGLGTFSTPVAPTMAGQASSSSALGDLFDFSTPASNPAPREHQVTSPTTQSTSVFNLTPAQPAQSNTQSLQSNSALNAWSNTDAWGSNDAWGSASTAPAKSPPISKQPASFQSTSSPFGWASTGSLANESIVPSGGGGFTSASTIPPKASADEDFGGWSSAAPVTPAAGSGTAKPVGGTGFAASEDLFSNVWE